MNRNIPVTVHNAVIIIALAILGILALRLAAKSPLGSLPVVGSVVQLAATA